MTDKDASHPNFGQSLAEKTIFLLKDSAVYGLAGVISRLSSLVVFPVLARHFSVAEYGVIDFYMVFGAFMVLLFVFGQDSAVARFFYQYDKMAERKQLISQSLLFQLASICLLLPLFWITSPALSFLLPGDSGDFNFFHITLLHVPFLLLINFSLNILKWTYQRNRFLIISLGSTATQMVLLTVGVTIYNFEIREVLIAYMLSSALVGCLGIYFIRGWFVLPNSIRFLKEMLSFGVPFGIMAVFGAFLPTLQRVVIDDFLGSEQMGLFAVATKISILISLPVTAFQMAWGPFSLAQYREPNIGETFNFVLRAFTCVVCFMALALSALAGPLITLLASDRYAGATFFVYPLIAALSVQALSWITEIGITISKRTHLALYAYALYGGIFFLLLWIFTSRYGLFGVAIAALISQVLRAVLATYCAQKAYPLDWPFRQIVLFAGGGIVFALLGLLGTILVPQVSLSLVHGTLAVAWLAFGWRYLFSGDERAYFTGKAKATIGLVLRRPTD